MWKQILYLSWLVAAPAGSRCDDRLAGYGADP